MFTYGNHNSHVGKHKHYITTLKCVYINITHSYYDLLKGMAVKLPTEETHYFDYAWPPFAQSPRDLEWMGLAEHQVTYPHLQV